MPRGVPRRPEPVTTVTTHPVAMKLARELAGDDPERPVVPESASTALICNRPGLFPPTPPPTVRKKRRT